MGAIENLEDDLFEGAGFLILFIFIGMGILGYMAVKSIALPEGAYPYPIFSKFASWVDGVFFNMPEFSKPFVKPFQDPIDENLGAIGNWINDNLPRTPSLKKSLEESHSEQEQPSNSDGGSVDADNPGSYASLEAEP